MTFNDADNLAKSIYSNYRKLTDEDHKAIKKILDDTFNNVAGRNNNGTN